MSACTGPRSWLELKHGGAPRYASFACGGPDSDWDYVGESLDNAASYNRGYHFSSENNSIPLRNNDGGMDEDERPTTDVWYPHQQASAESSLDSDSEMSDSMDMDMSNNTMEVETPQQVQPAPSKKRSAEAFEFNMNTGIGGYDLQQRQGDWMAARAIKRVRAGGRS